MEKQSFFDKVFIQLPGILLVISLLTLLITTNNDKSPAWLEYLWKTSCASFWFMPAIYLLVRRNLVIAFVNFLWPRKSKFNPIPEPPLIPKRNWAQLNFEEKVIIYMVVVIGIIIGVFLLAEMFSLVHL